jgi:HSP20 family molecular chaperone IbpA
MPGVEKEGLDINLEKGVLTLNGEVKTSRKGNSIFSEFSSANYYRQFKVSEHLDTEQTSAEFKNGVLTLTMPKAEAAKPKKIQIQH